MINSLRIADVPLLPYMDRPADTKAGMKHRCTDAAMEYFKSEVMEMCHDAGLYQIDLLNGSHNRVTEREYWAVRREQAALDAQNASADNDKAAPVCGNTQAGKPSKFETEKEKLRKEIRAALREADSFDAFRALLARRGITVKESRGRLSYLTPDRTKPITARRLGDDFDRAAVWEALERNAKRQRAPVPERPERTERRGSKPSIREQLQRGQAVQRVIDIEEKKAEGKGAGYEKWAKSFNLKQEAAALVIYQQSGFGSMEELNAALSASYGELGDARKRLRAVEDQLREKKEFRDHVLSYRKRKPLRDEWNKLKTAKSRAILRRQHEDDFAVMDADVRYFEAHGLKKLPTVKALQVEIEALIEEKNVLYGQYREQQSRTRELQTVRDNLYHTLGRQAENAREVGR